MTNLEETTIEAIKKQRAGETIGDALGRAAKQSAPPSATKAIQENTRHACRLELIDALGLRREGAPRWADLVEDIVRVRAALAVLVGADEDVSLVDLVARVAAEHERIAVAAYTTVEAIKGLENDGLITPCDCGTCAVCESRTFTCAGCKRDVPWSMGADDDHPEHCDDCAIEATS